VTWWHVSGALILSATPGNLVVALGRLAGLLAESAVLLQVALVRRLPWLERFSFRAGQYANVSFFTKGHWAPHPFSFSAAPNGRFLRISIKAVGDFTDRIRHLTPGAFVLVDGRVHRASASIDHKYLMVAGGIGITPKRWLEARNRSRRRTAAISIGSPSGGISVREMPMSCRSSELDASATSSAPTSRPS
jgi:predicted ferric reductase